MIIPNGTILPKTSTGGGIDPLTGLASAPVEAFGKPIPCQWIAQSYNALAKVLGEPATIASYQVLIELQPFDAPALRLKDDSGEVLGDYSIKQVETLEAVGQLRLWI